jgi:hypothetical protein
MLAFAHIQKTAGVTVNRILRRSFGLQHCDVEPWSRVGEYYDTSYSAEDHRKLKRLYPRLVSIAGHQVKPHSDLKDACPDVRYFTFLRNPETRTASHYQYAVQRMGEKEPFKEWIKSEKRRDAQTKHIAGRADLESAIKILDEECLLVGLVERFDESLVILRRKLGDPRLDIRYTSENVARDSSVKTRLLDDPSTRALLRDANAIDNALYDYVVRELYERQKQAFGATLAEDVESFKARNAPSHVNLNAALNLIKRNLIYKPMLRYAQRTRTGDL